MWRSMKRWGLLSVAVAGLAACGWMVQPPQRQEAASVVEYLYPDPSDRRVPDSGSITELRIPVRVGIAYVPTTRETSLSEAERLDLLGRVKRAFEAKAFIDTIEVIPTGYLQPKGGFANLEQVARTFQVDVMALVSYDQLQFNDPTSLSVFYWTIVGAYVVPGDKYDTRTLLDIAVFDVNSRRLLLRAPGSSVVKGRATLVEYGEEARAARESGFSAAVDDLIPRLDAELATFEAKAKAGGDPAIQVTRREGYGGGGGAADVWVVLAAAAAAALALSRRS